MVVAGNFQATEKFVQSAFQTNPSYTFLTITRTGSSYINNVIIGYLFQDQVPLCTGIDSKRNHVDFFVGTRVYITENINKADGNR